MNIKGLNRFLTFINRPYHRSGSDWNIILFTSLFIASVMIVLQPFGISSYAGSNKIFILLGYGVVTFLGLFIDLIVIPSFAKKWFTPEAWTLRKEILWIIWIIFTISAGNYFYSVFIFSFPTSLYVFLIFQAYTWSLGVIPVVVILILEQNKTLAQNLKLAQEINLQLQDKHSTPSAEEVSLTSENEKERLSIPLENLMYITSIGNYVHVFYTQDNQLQSTLLRSSLKRIESSLSKFPVMVKCHRAFLINSNMIVHLNGNSHQLKVSLQGVDTGIPVSRKYTRDLKNIVYSRR